MKQISIMKGSFSIDFDSVLGHIAYAQKEQGDGALSDSIRKYPQRFKGFKYWLSSSQSSAHRLIQKRYVELLEELSDEYERMLPRRS